MLKKIQSENMGDSNLGWLKSKLHFSFAEYYNPYNIKFGALRVINDDLIEPDTGFDTHPHKNMEIITYVINGELTHEDSMGNKKTITRGHVQYMSAGTGIYHSEFNFGQDMLRLLQIWIYPDKEGYKPDYGDYKFDWNDRENNWLHMASSKSGEAPIKINQDMNVYSLELEKDKEINFTVSDGRQAYLVQIEGISRVNDIELNKRDGMEIVEEDILIYGKETSHILVLEMKKEK